MARRITVYVESNFLLELARQQEEVEAAEGILELAEAKHIDLRFPVFSACEPFSTLTYYARERRNVFDAVNRLLDDLDRSQPQRQLVADLRPLTARWISVDRAEMDGLENTVSRLFKAGTAMALIAPVVGRAFACERRFNLSPQDALVLASILDDLERQPQGSPKLFVSRNARDFHDSDIANELHPYDCRYIPRFADALNYLQSLLAAT